MAIIRIPGTKTAAYVPDKEVENISDGYHTFKELYHHRACLFASICNMFPNRAWKSLKHHDDTMYRNMFIVGIDTDDGLATYHYDIDPYWEMFDVKELETAPEFDGHTPEIAVQRILQLSENHRTAKSLFLDRNNLS